MTIVLGLIACCGITATLMYGSILDIIRTWVVKLTFFEKLLKCSLCTGFWVGVLVGSYIYPVESKEFWFFAFASSAICWLYDSVVGMVQAIDAHFE